MEPDSVNLDSDPILDQQINQLKIKIQRMQEENKSLDETCKEIDISRERVRQIEARAFRKMRHPSNSEQLLTFLEEANE